MIKIAREMLAACPSLTLSEESGQLVGSLDGDPVVVVINHGSAADLLVRDWLEALPGRSSRLQPLVTGDDRWSAVRTESEWLMRGILSRAAKRIEARANLASTLDAHLTGRTHAVTLGPTTAEFWKALAKWGKETEALKPADRHFAWMYAERLERKVEVSAKFKSWAERKAPEALALGFQPPTRIVPQ